jgi:hypothetical protein
LEKVQEEYVEGQENPVYTNADTGETLDYTSYDRLLAKYVSGAKKNITIKIKIPSFGDFLFGNNSYLFFKYGSNAFNIPSSREIKTCFESGNTMTISASGLI